MQAVGVVFLSFGIVSFFLAGSFFLLYRTFEYHNSATDKMTASLIDVHYKKDVPVYGRRIPIIGGPIRVVMKIKNHSKGKYEYYVNQKRYRIHYAEHVTFKQMPRIVSVIYLKRFPKIAYVQTDTNAHHFEIYSVVFVLLGVLFLIGGFSVLF